MATGTIKRLVRERGFGFIQGQDGVELFFHRSALQGEASDTLAEGQAVTFNVEKGDKGPRTANMKVSPPAPSGRLKVADEAHLIMRGEDEPGLLQ